MKKKFFQSFFISTADIGQRSRTNESCSTLCCTNVMAYFYSFPQISRHICSWQEDPHGGSKQFRFARLFF